MISFWDRERRIKSFVRGQVDSAVRLWAGSHPDLGGR
jgi:hypothetical protein